MKRYSNRKKRMIKQKIAGLILMLIGVIPSIIFKDITDLTYFPYMYPLYQLVLNYQGPNYITDITPLMYMPSSLQHLS